MLNAEARPEDTGGRTLRRRQRYVIHVQVCQIIYHIECFSIKRELDEIVENSEKPESRDLKFILRPSFIARRRLVNNPNSVNF